MDERRMDLLEKADKCLDFANLLAESGDYCGAVNRSFYAQAARRVGGINFPYSIMAYRDGEDVSLRLAPP